MSERTILFGASSGLVGTLALPNDIDDASTFGFLLFNAGVIHRIGPHRINVRIARELVACGVPSIRFDLAGHGDSVRPDGNHSFEEQAVIDIRSAMDALGAAAKVQRFAIFGFCSGAYFGYAAAQADERVAGLFMFDAYRYPTLKTRVLHYWNRLHQPRALRAILQVVKRAILRGTRREAGAIRAIPPAGSELGRIDFIPSKQEFAKGLHALVDRGVQIHLVYSGGDLREYNYAGQFADAFSSCGLSQRIHADFVPRVDHVVTGLADQATLTQRVVDWSLALRRSM